MLCCAFASCVTDPRSHCIEQAGIGLGWDGSICDSRCDRGASGGGPWSGSKNTKCHNFPPDALFLAAALVFWPHDGLVRCSGSQKRKNAKRGWQKLRGLGYVGLLKDGASPSMVRAVPLSHSFSSPLPPLPILTGWHGL